LRISRKSGGIAFSPQESTVKMVWQSEYKPNTSSKTDIVLLVVAPIRSTSLQPSITTKICLHRELQLLPNLQDSKRNNAERFLEMSAMSSNCMLSMKRRTILLVAPCSIRLTILRICGKEITTNDNRPLHFTCNVDGSCNPIQEVCLKLPYLLSSTCIPLPQLITTKLGNGN